MHKRCFVLYDYVASASDLVVMVHLQDDDDDAPLIHLQFPIRENMPARYQIIEHLKKTHSNDRYYVVHHVSHEDKLLDEMQR